MSSYSLGVFLRELIQQQGIGVTELARRARLSRECIYKLQRGDIKQPELSTIICLAKALHTHPLLLLRKLFEGQEFRSAAQPPARHANDAVGFLGDITCPDNCMVGVNSKFTKVWEIQNTGLLVWRGRRLVCVDEWLEVRVVPAADTKGGRWFRAPARQRCLIPATREIPIPDTKPGGAVRLSVEFTTPPFPCTTISYWKMVDESGAFCFPNQEGLSCLVQVVTL